MEKNLYHIPTGNVKTGKTEINTLMKNDFSPVTELHELGPQEDFVSYKKPVLQDAPIDRQARLDLEKMLNDNRDAFAKDERQIGTISLIKMSIDTGDHPPIAKKSYTIALKHYDWGEGGKLTNCFRQG